MKCKYYNKCEHASSSALTCTSGGGTYCGKFRIFSAGSPPVTPTPIVSPSHPSTHKGEIAG